MLNSVLYNRFQAKLGNSAPLIITARGKAWCNPNHGLSKIGWIFIGKIYSNLYIYKLHSESFQKTEGFSSNLYTNSILKKDIFIFVITPQKGGRVNIYKRYKGHGVCHEPMFTLLDVAKNYRSIGNKADRFYIKKSDSLDGLFSQLACLWQPNE